MSVSAQKGVVGLMLLVVCVALIGFVVALYWGSQYACIHHVAPHIVGDDLLARTIWCRPGGSSR